MNHRRGFVVTSNASLADNYRYVVYAGEGGDFPCRGIIVEQSGKRIADLRC